MSANVVAVKFGEHTYLARWMRERGRNRKIARLKINSTLKVQRNGSAHQCKVKKGHYLYEGQKFPTLYKVTEHITGKGSVWSGPKFWKLT